MRQTNIILNNVKTYNELSFFSFGLVMKIRFIDNNLWTKSHCLCILFVICITTIFFSSESFSR